MLPLKKILCELKDSGLELMGQAWGSTHDISKYTSEKTGQTYYVKFSAGLYQDKVAHNMQSIIELMAYRIYELYNLSIPSEAFLVLNKKNDAIGIATVELQGSESFTDELRNDPNVEKAFLPAVLTANYDLLGTPPGANTVKTEEGIYIIDPGGSFHFRARGMHKDYGDEPFELSSMRNPEYPAGQVFDYLEDDSLIELKKDFEQVSISDVLGAIDRTVDEASQKINKISNSKLKSELMSRLQSESAMIKSSIAKRHKNILNSI
jgi:hypothetical protein